MSTLTSASTDAAVWASYDDNASYEEDSSRTEALAFITACRILLRRRPKVARRGGQNIEFDANLIRSELESAQAWLNLHPSTTTTRTRYGSLEGFRDE